ncbi:MAG: metal ABC transporter solute-binding protein, Zn/Mn family [Bacillota bacterium]
MKTKLSLFLSLLIFLLLPLLAVNTEARASIKIAAGISPLETFVQKVGGENVETMTMIPQGYSPTNYAPNAAEMRKISEVQLYFTFVMPAEKANILPEIDSFNNEIEIIKLNDIIAEKYEPRYFGEKQTTDEKNTSQDNDHNQEEHEEEEEENSHNHSAGEIDPHIWLSPQRVIYVVEIIAEKLSEIDPDNREYYQENAAEYQAELEKMAQEIKEKLAPIKGQTIFIYHPVIGYFTDEYDLEMEAIEKNGKKATPKRLQELIDLASKKNIRAVFHQASVDSKQTSVLASEIGAETVEITPLHRDYIASMKEIANLIYEYRTPE